MASDMGARPSVPWQFVVSSSKAVCGEQAALKGAQLIREAISKRGSCNIILATGSSQLDMLEHLVTSDGVDWNKVTCFHLDEYIGLSDDHPASFVGYLRERFLNKLPTKPAAFHFINGLSKPEVTCKQLGNVIKQHQIDVAFIGIGENGHLAFNDPPADFETEEPYISVQLAESCRKQQLGEGWFATLEEVPQQAITMSIHQIMAAQHLIVTVPEKRKAKAVHDTIMGEVDSKVPATILQRHAHCYLYLDIDSTRGTRYQVSMEKTMD